MKQMFSILCAGAAVAAVAVGAALAAGCASAPSDPLIVRTKAGLVKGVHGSPQAGLQGGTLLRFVIRDGTVQVARQRFGFSGFSQRIDTAVPDG